MWLPFLVCFILLNLSSTGAGYPLEISVVWEGEAGHDTYSMPQYLDPTNSCNSLLLNNITMELMSGSEEDAGNNVTDIICVGYSSTELQGSNVVYQLHSAVSSSLRFTGGDAYFTQDSSRVVSYPYDVRIWNLAESLCVEFLAGFTPVRSITDPAYTPLQIQTPGGGGVCYQTELIGPTRAIFMDLAAIDTLFDPTNMDLTVEVVRTDSGYSTAVQTIPQKDTSLLEFNVYTGNVTLDPGGWRASVMHRISLVNQFTALQVRVNYSSSSPHDPGKFVALSDEFYVALQAPCVGLAVANSTSTSTSTSATPKPMSSGSNSPPSPNAARNSKSSCRLVTPQDAVCPLPAWHLGLRGERTQYAVGPAASVRGSAGVSPALASLENLGKSFEIRNISPRSGPPRRADAPRSGPSGERSGGSAGSPPRQI
ncbi:hypothetical protein B0H10DRAFT_1937706 [Mycena sp. CBHHK59/15]|nr:hypothetical protein B0H10DRAFT_1937706 [Mycena sp. CBHHK59/15]